MRRWICNSISHGYLLMPGVYSTQYEGILIQSRAQGIENLSGNCDFFGPLRMVGECERVWENFSNIIL